MVPQETLTRRQLFRSVFDRTREVTAVSALLAACTPSAPNVDQKVASAIPSAPPAGGISAETAKPVELADQAKNILLDRWLSLLNSPQKTSESGYETFLDIRVKNMEGWKRNIPRVFTNQGSPADAIMNVSWVSGQTFLASGGWNAWKFTGEIEIKEVRVALTDQRGTGKPDDNGFQWSGELRLDMRTRSHTNNYFFNEFNTNGNDLMAWLSSPEDKAFRDFSPWEGESFSAKLVLQKGVWTWEVDSFKRGQFDGSRGYIGDSLDIPFGALRQAGKCTEPSIGCFKIPAFK